MTPLTLDLSPVIHLTDAELERLCRANRELQLECTAQGELVIMSPVGGESGNQEIELGADLVLWNRRTGLGKVFSSSTLFRLPNGAARSPDLAWIQLERWQALAPEQRQRFPPICPDFVLELRSPSDPLSMLQEKMQEYLDNGVRLGWLIDPRRQQVEIYRPTRSVEIRSIPVILSGEAILPGFELSL